MRFGSTLLMRRHLFIAVLCNKLIYAALATDDDNIDGQISRDSAAIRRLSYGRILNVLRSPSNGRKKYHGDQFSAHFVSLILQRLQHAVCLIGRFKRDMYIAPNVCFCECFCHNHEIPH